jgi:hypothetical protein
VRLHQNYRSTRCIVEAATSLIKHNTKRCQEKQVHTDNSAGDRVSIHDFHPSFSNLLIYNEQVPFYMGTGLTEKMMHLWIVVNQQA